MNKKINYVLVSLFGNHINTILKCIILGFMCNNKSLFKIEDLEDGKTILESTLAG